MMHFAFPARARMAWTMYSESAPLRKVFSMLAGACTSPEGGVIVTGFKSRRLRAGGGAS
jgi:hypothetical protein